MHILLLVTDNKTSRISGREENDHRNFFMINLYESIGPGRIELLTLGAAVRHAFAARDRPHYAELLF